MIGNAGRLRSRNDAGPAIRLPAAALLSVVLLGTAAAAPTPAGPASAQPSLPKPIDDAVPLSSPVLGGGAGGQATGRAKAGAAGRSSERVVPSRRYRRRLAARHGGLGAEPLDRPALAGVELVAPIPVPRQPPHATVPVPAYLPENAAAFFTTPLPPVVCHRVPRDRGAPDPHLLRETTVLCEADNP